jgi:hypothetical protein
MNVNGGVSGIEIQESLEEPRMHTNRDEFSAETTFVQVEQIPD